MYVLCCFSLFLTVFVWGAGAGRDQTSLDKSWIPYAVPMLPTRNERCFVFAEVRGGKKGACKVCMLF